MKKLIIFLILAVFSAEVFAQTLTASTTLAVAKWDQTTVNVGNITFDQPATVNFTVTNVGSVPLQIMGVQRSGNCTVPEWTSKPIPPGATGVIKVVYDAKVGGYFNKIIKVTSNTEEGATELIITGEVTSNLNN
jgi:hypothetical protein